MGKTELKNPALYISRELSWLEFNHRVLREGASEEVPLLERLKFLAIVSSNLDEFFMIRVGGLRQQRRARPERRDASGLSADEQLGAIRDRVKRMAAEQSQAVRVVAEALRPKGIALLDAGELTGDQHKFLARFFRNHVLPALTPLAVEELDPCPVLPGLQLYVALLAAASDAGAGERARLVVVPVPRDLSRFVTVPSAGRLDLARLEDVIVANAPSLLPGTRIEAATLFRLTRDGDVPVDLDDAPEPLVAVEQAVSSRRRREVVRVELAAGTAPALKDRLLAWLATGGEELFEIDGMLDAAALMEVAGRSGFDELKDEPWEPQPPRDLAGAEDLWEAIRERDVLLFHPYESFEPVVRLIDSAADDPSVMAIKQTLYRTSGDSPIIKALARAAKAGKQVVVLVELKARFDEARNVDWARRLEEAGCLVLYGIAGYKTHAKALLIVRREARRINRYLHLGTGNYHDKTAKLYSDIGLLTSDRDMTADAAAFFNLLTGYSQDVGWKALTIAPTGLRQRFVDLIDREIQASTPDRPGLIMAKVNSLQDPGIIQALYRASQAGVRVRLNVRGICCLRPGVKGVSENIEVLSIIDRYLEHARVFYFRNGGHEEVYMSSADWMTRNIDKRLEILFPVRDAAALRRLIGMLETFFADNVKARRLLPDGTYEPVARTGPRARAQEVFHAQAVQAAREQPIEFRPLTRPQD
ncbi:MAG TPA: polyphosphate kinase 1 [Phycisphaerae bacterium]|nr:polyphosphate kinase 1 [Phycisphaerae bacterium]HUU22351.1 polyphosphate kinase 1 [Phycisphaerae bacterium]